MAEARRSMADAMLSPEKVAFIRGEVHKSSGGETLEERRSESITNKAQSVRVTEVLSEEAGEAPPVLVPLTTRLHPEVADALRRANLEQRLKRRNPQTVQEIVELSLRTWLSKAGFLESP